MCRFGSVRPEVQILWPRPGNQRPQGYAEKATLRSLRLAALVVMIAGDAEREGGTVPIRELSARPACPPKDWLDYSMPSAIDVSMAGNEKRTRVHTPAMLWWRRRIWACSIRRACS